MIGMSAVVSALVRGSSVARRRAFSASTAWAPALPSRVNVYEVGARDGLQNEATTLSVDQRLEFIEMLSHTGVHAVEVAAFVNAKRVPQMAGAADIMSSLAPRADRLPYPVLVPNMTGFRAAVNAGAKSVAVMASASETFSRNNVNSTIEESVERSIEIAAEAAKLNVSCRAYLSCALGCPFEGAVAPSVVADIAARLFTDANGAVYEVVLSDTIGTGTAGDMAKLLRLTLPRVPAHALAVHSHDTYGQALANIYCALEHGIATVDSSVAGLGGCPFAGPGAAGNVATEDVVYMLNGLDIETGVDFDRVVDAGEWAVAQLGRENASKAALASLRRGRGSQSEMAARAQPPRLSMPGSEFSTACPEPAWQRSKGGQDGTRLQ